MPRIVLTLLLWPGLMLAQLPSGGLSPTNTQPGSTVTAAPAAVVGQPVSPASYTPPALAQGLFTMVSSGIVKPSSGESTDGKSTDVEVFVTGEAPPCDVPSKTDIDKQMPGPTWDIKSVETVGGKTSPCLWKMTLSIGESPLAGPYTHRVSLQASGKTGVIAVTVFGQKAADQTATIGVVPYELNARLRCVSIPLAVKGAPLRKVSILISGLVDSSTGWIIPADQIEPKVVSEDGHSAVLSLTLKDSFTTSGNFAGPVYIASGEEPHQPQIGPINLTVHSTSSAAKAWGVLLILLGCVLFAYFGVLRQRSRWDDAILPAQRLAERARLLQRRAANVSIITGAPLPHLLGNPAIGIQSELKIFIAQCAPSRLKTMLPSKWFPGFYDDAARNTAYSSWLQTQGAILESLALIVVRGLEMISGQWNALNAVQQTAAQPHLTVLDAMSVMPDAPQQVRSAVANEVNAALGPLGGAPAQADSTDTLSAQMRSTALATWIFALVLTVALGAIFQVILNPAFGTPTDFAKCLLWGCGLPAAGQTLQSIVPSSVLSAFSLQVPK